MVVQCKEISKEIRENVKNIIDSIDKKPCLAVIIVGDNAASQIYVRNKEKACAEVGIVSKTIRLSSDTTNEAVIDEINRLNGDNNINGVLVQLPLPKHLDENKIINTIKPEKDVDGLTEINMGKLFSGSDCITPCTPSGCMYVMRHCGVDFVGKRACVIGRSNLVGKPIAMLLMKAGSTVTICHSKTKNLMDVTKEADIIVCAVGKPKFVVSDMVKDEAVVIDVGINRLENGKTVGDVDTENVKDIADIITPVPGGIGIMTVTMLLVNTIKCYDIQNKTNLWLDK